MSKTTSVKKNILIIWRLNSINLKITNQIYKKKNLMTLKKSTNTIIVYLNPLMLTTNKKTFSLMIKITKMISTMIS